MTTTRTEIHADLVDATHPAEVTASIAEHQRTFSGQPFIAATLTIGGYEACIYLRHPETIAALRGALRHLDEELGQTTIAQTAEVQAVA